MRLLLSHSQQLLNSQTQAYANLLCWRPSNLFPPLAFQQAQEENTGKKKQKKKPTDTLKGAILRTQLHFILAGEHYVINVKVS